MLAAEASTLAHHLDTAGAVTATYARVEEWERAIPGILASMTPATLPLMRLTASMFYDGIAVTRNTDASILFLTKVSLGDLVRADAAMPDSDYVAYRLAKQPQPAYVSSSVPQILHNCSILHVISSKAGHFIDSLHLGNHNNKSILLFFS